MTAEVSDQHAASRRASTGPQQADDSSWHPLLRLLTVLAEQRPMLLATVVTAVLAQLCTIGATGIAAWLVGRTILAGAAGGGETGGLALLGGTALTAGILHWLHSWVSHLYAFRLIAALRMKIFDGLERLAPGRLVQRRTGDVVATAVSDIERLEWIYAHQLPSVVVALVVPVAALVGLSFVAPLIGLVVVLAAVVLGTVPAWLAARAHAQGKALRAELGRLHADVVDGVQGLRELVAFGAGRRYLRGIAEVARSLRGLHLAYGRRAGLENGTADLIVASTVVVALGLGVAAVTSGTLPRAWLPVVVVLAGAVLTPVMQVVSTSSAVGELRGCAARITAVTDAPAPVVERTDARRPPQDLEPRVRFEDVRFAYEAGGPPVLRGVCFEIAPGEVVALVGASGAGKSTCLNLLARFWDVDGGRITLGGHDIRDFTLEGLRGLLAVVPQEVYLFRTTLRENLRLARPAATDEQVRHAAMLAGVTEFAVQLPDGLDTPVAERGLSLSGGQRQRLAIARALLRAAPVLVLDEAVSNVDIENELLVHRTLAELRHGRATLVIAHRLSTIRAADRIVVLDEGRIVESGSHDELTARRGRYAELMAAGQIERPR
ncbi:ABC transporter [Longimycelium tulufanense]|uniref:ABC transporter n=1 Tax=Longimycelium tulufanense TaxID=907463 RepID=A0A8J3CJU6_9PSEU|nr:ABC transporter ATP-binding protein [Longimycelium tulufanense]GGM78809.1 ABC transporter [Longimycelium tulufanense]